MTPFNRLAIQNPDELLFGVSPRPLTTRSGMTIGGGIVYPELNFTLPAMLVNEATLPEVRQHYLRPWLNRIQEAVEGLPGDENQFISDMMARLDTTKFVPADYGL